MRILEVVLSAELTGGIEIYSRDIAFSLERLGHEVKILSVLDSQQTFPQWDNIPVKRLAPKHSQVFRLYFRLWKRFLSLYLHHVKEEYDVVLIMHPLAAPAARQSGLATYWTWTYGLEVWGDLNKELTQAFLASSRILTISNFTKNMLMKQIGNKQIDIVKPVVDIRSFVPSILPSSSIPHYRILTVGRLASSDRRKGHEIVFRNLRDLSEKLGVPVEYWIVGDGDDRPRLEIIVNNAGLTDQVKFLGRLSPEELVVAYQNCDLFVMLSLVEQLPNGKWTGEGFGIVYLEANACGKPVLGGNTGGEVDAILHGETGFCIDLNSDENFVNTALQLLSNVELCKSIGYAGRQRVIQEFSFDALDLSLKHLLQSV